MPLALNPVRNGSAKTFHFVIPYRAVISANLRITGDGTARRIPSSAEELFFAFLPFSAALLAVQLVDVLRDISALYWVHHELRQTFSKNFYDVSLG